MGIPTLIATNSDSTDVANISFTSGIDSTYDEYMFVGTDIGPATDDTNLLFQCSIDGGSNYNVVLTTTIFRSYVLESGSGYLQYFTDSPGFDQAQGTSFQALGAQLGNGSDESGSFILNLFTPSSTTYVKHFYSRSHVYYAGDGAMGFYVAGYFNDGDDDINAIQFKMSSGNLDGTIQMYGIA